MIKACIQLYRRDRQIKNACKAFVASTNSESFREYIILNKYNSVLSKVHVYSELYRFTINRKTYTLHLYIDTYSLKLHIVDMSLYKKSLIKKIKTCFLTLFK